MATAIELSCREFIAESEGSESSPTHIISAKKFRFGFFRKISLTEEEANSITFVKIHQVVILICSILLMICLLQIPTILYYTNSPSFSSIGTFDIGIDVDFNACSVNTTSRSLPNISLDDVCPQVPPLTTQDETFYEICLSQSLRLIKSVHAVNMAFNNSQCNSRASPFFCNATYSLCGDGTYMIMDISEVCLQVRDHDCAVEWRVLENFLNIPIPDCDSYSEDGNLSFAKAPSLNCPDQFDTFFGSLCLPVCSEFYQISENAAAISDALTIAFEAIGITGGIITLVACVFNRKKMFKFPQIFIIYNTVIVITILAFLILPLVIGFLPFLCSDQNLFEALKAPTRFCQAQGFILHTGILCFLGFWLFHLAHLLYALAFPIKAKNLMQEYTTAFHTTEVILVLILGSLPGAVIVSTSNYQINRFPPDLCTAANLNIFFHTFVLPIAICTTLGLIMSFTAFWILRRNHQLNTARLEKEAPHKTNLLVATAKSFCTGFSTPEKKLFFLFWYYIIVVVTLLAFFTAVLQQADPTSDHLHDYISCSVAGYKPECEVYKEKLRNTSNTGYLLDMFATMLLCSVTLSNLTYVLQFSAIKQFYLKILKHAQRI